MACDKEFALSHLVREIENVFMHYSPDKKLRRSYVRSNGAELIPGIIDNSVVFLLQEL